jgi:hypothetical protein
VDWNNPERVVASEVSRATAGIGISRYLAASGFGFAIPIGFTIDGIEVEIERSAQNTGGTSMVGLLDGWTTGTTKTISAGTNRCLVVIASTENGDGATDVSGLTYGGQALTQVGEYTVGTPGGFSNRIEVWILLDAGISAASGTTLVPVISAVSFIEPVEIYTSAVFNDVDQVNTIFQVQNSSTTSSAASYQLASPLTTLTGSMSIAAIACGNNTIPASVNGGTNTYTVNSGFTEGTDIYFSNPTFSTSGASLLTAHKASSGVGTEQPTFTFAGTPNRQIAVALTLQGASAVDNSVRLMKAGVITGADRAQTTVTWPTGDSYAVYGGASDLWGTTWTLADINDANFGVVLSANKQSDGNLRVDHIRITIHIAPTPIELLYFKGKIVDQEVLLQWETATEHNNDFFTVEFSPNGLDFSPIEMIDGAGDSKLPIRYETTHSDVRYKDSYYRLKQTDYDGQFTYSNVIYLDTRDLIKDLSLFPNPANTSITILNSSEQDVSVRIMSQTGVVVAAYQPEREFQEINVADIPNGLYLVELVRGRSRNTQKLLISH